MALSTYSAIGLLFLAASVTLAAVLPPPVPDTTGQDADVAKLLAANPRLDYIGVVEGKKLYYDTVLRSWSDADLFCRGLGMNLFAIESLTQYNAIPSTLDYLWVAGRDIGTRAQFKWDHTGGAIGSFLTFRNYDGSGGFPTFPRRSCLAFDRSHVSDRPCTTLYKTLCEST